MIAVSHTWLVSTLNVASRTEDMNYKFYLILNHLKLNSHMSLLVNIRDSASCHPERRLLMKLVKKKILVKDCGWPSTCDMHSSGSIIITGIEYHSRLAHGLTSQS